MYLLITGGTREARRSAAHRRLAVAAGVVTIEAAALPFVRPAASGAGQTLLVHDVERAFPNQQVGGTRLVLTQSTYTLQKWVDVLGSHGSVILTADRDALRHGAAEMFEGRGPWARFEVIHLHDAGDEQASAAIAEDAGGTRGTGSAVTAGSAHFGSSAVARLIDAYSAPSAEERLAACREAIALASDSEIAHLALASACREVNDMKGARAALDCALALAPSWEAVHFEDGKFWLGYDDMERARDAFQRACDLMPTFSTAYSNLGATAGELDDPDRALAAFRQALVHDPRGVHVLNNIGVVTRELGRLADSEASFRRVLELAPDFVFGYYNLGHTLFLAGRYGDALEAYEEGQRRDPGLNRRQGCRLAMMRLANGDAAGAERDLWRFANEAPADERPDLLFEAYEIATAILAVRPELAAHRSFVDRIGAEIAP